MKESKPKYFQKVTVVFGPGEEKAFLDTYGNDWRCLGMSPRTDLKPWGTREALMERQVKYHPRDVYVPKGCRKPRWRATGTIVK